MHASVSSRRRFLASLGPLVLCWLSSTASALTANSLTEPVAGMLDGPQSDCLRAWMTLIVAEQIRKGPSPRWYHRDCAGLARFAVNEALRSHDLSWRKANGLLDRRLPPEVGLRPEQETLRDGWTGLDGERQSFVTAQILIQNNSRLLGREAAMARPGDLLFFDQGDDQHLMIWMGSWIAYHTGQGPAVITARSADARRQPKNHTPQSISQDNGLRAVTLADLLQWKDTRWRPRDDNPNFSGFFRLAFLSR